MAETEELSPFQKVTLELTGGCGCACHTGMGFKTTCEHCWNGGWVWTGYGWTTVSNGSQPLFPAPLGAQ